MRRNAHNSRPRLVIDSPEGPRLVSLRRRYLSGGGLIAVAALAMAAGLLLVNGAARQDATVQAAQAGPDTGQILVKFKPGASQQAIDALNAANGAQQVDQIAAIGVKVLKVGSAQAAAAVYAHNPLVQFAEPNSLIRPEAIPNDPNYSSEWHLAKIQAPSAWDSAKATGVLIAICDTGVAAVADLSSVLRGDLGWNAVDGSTNWTDVMGHGTQVAGVAAAATNNGAGVAGVAWGAQIIPVRISNFADGTAYTSDAAKCITYAADHGARAINLSYAMDGSNTIDSAGQYAQGRGALTTVAAGNSATNPGWSNLSGFLAVSGTTDSDQLAVWSNYGAFVDVSAPGNSIITTFMDGTYYYVSGTSFAAPVTAGVIALIFGANPSLSASQAQNVLLSSAGDLGATGWDASFGYGRVNAYKAVSAARGGAPTSSPTATAMPALTATPTSAAPSPTATSTSVVAPTATATKTAVDTTPPQISLASPTQALTLKGNATLAATATDNVGVTRVEFYVDGVLYRIVSSAPYGTSWNTRRWANGSHTIVARAYDAAGNAASDSHTVTVAN
jgi:thermitase